jgi:two-component system sensor histidine kinase/response regulator
LDDGAPFPFEPLIETVAAALDPVLQSIHTLETAQPNEAEFPDSADTGPLLDALLSKLTEAIDRADPEQIAALMPALRRQASRSGQVDPSAIALLEAQIERYDYDQALETIREFNRK